MSGSRWVKSYEQRVLDAIEEAVRKPQTPDEDDPLDRGPVRDDTLLVTDPETGLVYAIEVQLQ